MARKFQKQINELLEKRKLVIARQINRKTYHSAISYNTVMEKKGDLRYNFYFRHSKRWPGGTMEEWILKCPMTINGNIIDYGRGANKLSNQIKMESGMLLEYLKYHTPHLDHYPIPESDGGLRIFSNLKIVNKSANEARGNTPKDLIAEDVKNYAECYGISVKITSKND